MLTCSKVNLSLAVTAKRPDGYHDLDSLFYPFRDPSDEIRLEDASGTVLLRYEVPCSFSSAALSCPEMRLGETYTAVSGFNIIPGVLH